MQKKEQGIQGFLVRSIVKRPDYASAEGKTNPDVTEIDCALGHSPLGFPPEVSLAQQTVSDKDFNSYPSDLFGKTLSPLVQERFGLQRDTEIFFHGNGSYGLLASLLSDLVSPDAVRSGLFVTGWGPQFTNIVKLCDRASIPYEPVEPPLDISAHKKMADLINSRLQASQPAVVYVDNPNNPTGDVVHLSDLIILAEATKFQDLLIIDEAYGDHVDDSYSAFPLVEHYPHVIVMRSISKGIGLASVRLGYAAMSEPIAAEYKKMELVFSIDTMKNLIAQTALDPDVLARFLPEMRRRTGVLKKEMISVLRSQEVQVYPTHPSVSILLAQREQGFYNHLLSLGIKTEDGSTFYPTHSAMDDSLVRFRVPGSEEDIDTVYQRLALAARRNGRRRE